MSLPKIAGLEQEYALKSKGAAGLSPFQISCLLVNAYARRRGLRQPGSRILWDYAHETPFQDGRGSLFSKSARPEISSPEDNLLINAPLPNGGRLYTDHAHPEYSTPECLGAREVTAADKAGEAILWQGLAALRELLPDCQVELYKNNNDLQGHSYGTHENYLMSAAGYQRLLAQEPARTVATLVPFLVSRQLFTGAGRVGGPTGYELSQRAEFLTALFGLETTHNRSLINTRDEPHADPQRFRRLHLILGDANLSEFANFLKVGTTQLVLSLLEDDLLPRLELREPLAALRQVSQEWTAPLALSDGRRLTALELQEQFLEEVAAHPASYAWHPEAEAVLQAWSQTLEGLRQGQITPAWDLEDDPLELRRRLDWLAKLWLVQRYRRQKNLSWDNPTLQVLDLQYHRLDPENGLFFQLQRQGLMERLLSDQEIDALVTDPPATTRAFFRGRCLERFPDEVAMVNWEVIAFRRQDLCRMIPLPNPLQGTRGQMQELFDRAQDAFELIKLLA